MTSLEENDLKCNWIFF